MMKDGEKYSITVTELLDIIKNMVDNIIAMIKSLFE